MTTATSTELKRYRAKERTYEQELEIICKYLAGTLPVELGEERIAEMRENSLDPVAETENVRAIMAAALSLKWACACGWRGTPEQMIVNASDCRVCPGCGASGGLVIRDSISVILHPKAYGLRPVRVDVKNDTFIYYEATTFPKSPIIGCELYLRRCSGFGMLRDDGSYLTLDVLDRDESILQEFPITKHGFEYLRHKLKFRRVKDE